MELYGYVEVIKPLLGKEFMQMSGDAGRQNRHMERKRKKDSLIGGKPQLFCVVVFENLLWLTM